MSDTKNRLIEVFGVDCIYDEATNFINLDHLWHKPETLKNTVGITKSWLINNVDIDSVSAFVVADKLKFPFGVLPIISVLAHELDKSLIVWKEHADYFTGRSLCYGHGRENDNDNVIIFHDVFVNGYSVIKMIVALEQLAKKYKKKFVVSNIVSFIDRSDSDIKNQTIKLISSESKVDYISIMNFKSMIFHSS